MKLLIELIRDVAAIVTCVIMAVIGLMVIVYVGFTMYFSIKMDLIKIKQIEIHSLKKAGVETPAKDTYMKET